MWKFAESVPGCVISGQARYRYRITPDFGLNNGLQSADSRRHEAANEIPSEAESHSLIGPEIAKFLGRTWRIFLVFVVLQAGRKARGV